MLCKLCVDVSEVINGVMCLNDVIMCLRCFFRELNISLNGASTQATQPSMRYAEVRC